MQIQRIKKLQKNLKAPLLIRNSNDLFYLTGHFLIDSAFLFVSKNKVILFGGHLEQIRGVKTDFLRNISKYMGKGKTLEVDDHLNLAEQAFLKNVLRGVKISPVASPVKGLRLQKDASELTKMKQAYDITVKVFKEVKKALKSKRWTEIELAKFIRLAGLKLGADDISFPTIVASGANAAVPHHVPTNKAVKTGESIILDFGFKVDGYCSDFSRTVFIKTVPKQLEEIYIAAESAYKIAVKAVKEKGDASYVDGVAREHLAESKLDKYFIHSLGHGTGINVHESPSLYPNSEDVLLNGMVFSIEPGVYIPRLGGVRIEDLVYLKNGKANYFAKASTSLKDMII